MRKFIKSVLAVVACLAVGTAGYAAIILDDDGVGFVSKGDVQLLFGWDNKKLQACTNAVPASYDDAGCLHFDFAIYAVTDTTTTWTCTKIKKDGTPDTNERNIEITTTTNSGGVSAATARMKNQVTGFNLNGGTNWGTTTVVASEGPTLNSCPNDWTWAAGSTTTTPSVAGTSLLTITDTRSGARHTVELIDDDVTTPDVDESGWIKLF